MNSALTAFCIVASSAHAIPQDDPAAEAVIDANSKADAAETLLVGLVLREAAHELAADETFKDESDEYFFRKLFDVVKGAVEKVGEVVGTVGELVVKPVGAVVDAIKGRAFLSTQESVNEKAMKIFTKIFDKSVATYTFRDSKSGQEDFVKCLSKRVDTVARRLIENGKRALDVSAVDF